MAAISGSIKILNKWYKRVFSWLQLYLLPRAWFVLYIAASPRPSSRRCLLNHLLYWGQTMLKIWIVTLGLEMPAIWNALNLWEHKVLWLILIPSKLHKKLSLYCNCFCKIWNFINILALLNTSNSAHCVIRFRWNIHLIRERSLGGRKVSKQRLECSSKVGSGQSHKNTKNSDNNSK